MSYDRVELLSIQCECIQWNTNCKRKLPLYEPCAALNTHTHTKHVAPLLLRNVKWGKTHSITVLKRKYRVSRAKSILLQHRLTYTKLYSFISVYVKYIQSFIPQKNCNIKNAILKGLVHF